MPKNTNHKTAARNPRKAFKKRGKQPAAGRQAIKRKEAAAPRIIANSVFALTLKNKPAIAVQSIQDNKPSGLIEEDIDTMYKQVLKIIQHSVKLATGEETTFNPYTSGFDISESFDLIFRIFKTNVLPEKWEYNIEKDDAGNYSLVIFETCSFDSYWHCFHIRHVVEALAKKNPALHDFFVKFIRNFSYHTGMSTWYNGALGYADTDMLEEHFVNGEFDTEEEQLAAKKELDETTFCYNKGDANRYQKLISNSEIVSIADLRTCLKKFSRKNILVSWMYEACDFMDHHLTINDFIYYEVVDDYPEGLPFDQQAGIIWDAFDLMTKEQEDYLEAEANGMGIHEPVFHVKLTEHRTSIDFEYFKKALQWPKLLTKIFNSYNNAILQYERKN